MFGVPGTLRAEDLCARARRDAQAAAVLPWTSSPTAASSGSGSPPVLLPPAQAAAATGRRGKRPPPAPAEGAPPAPADGAPPEAAGAGAQPDAAGAGAPDESLGANQRFLFGIKVVLISVAAVLPAGLPSPTYCTSRDIPKKQDP